jgi:hypothetical protein
MTAWSIAYGHEKEHAADLRAGLKVLPEGFCARICPLCDGEGQRQQTYTRGCGMGYSTMVGGCDYCDGTGLLQGTEPAPSSVRVQVLEAALSRHDYPRD